MNKRMRLGVLTAVGVMLAMTGAVQAAAITVSAVAPTVDGADIAMLNTAGAYDIGGNQGHIWANRPAQGQTFTTGPNPAGYALSAVTLQTRQTQNHGGVFRVRVGGITGNTFTQVGNEDFTKVPYSANNYITTTFAAPITLNPNTLYGFDWGSSSGGFITNNNTDANYAGGSAYSTGGGGSGGGTVTIHSGTGGGKGDRVFHADLAAVGGPPVPVPVPVTVPNFNFELDNSGNPSTAKRGMDQVLGWTNQSGTTGVEIYAGGGTVGPMATYMGNASAFYQILNQPIAEGETYKLTYDGRTNCCGGNTLRASFFYDNSGHVEIAGVPTGGLGGWTSIDTLSFTAQAGQGYLGQNLGIKFEAPTDWMGVDNVRLTVTAPATVIPEPITMLALALGISGLGGYIRKRRRA